MPAPYKPGRDDTRFGRLARELHAETAAYLAAVAHSGNIRRSAELNDQLAGRWAVWFEVIGSVRWLAERTRGRKLRLEATTADELLAKIEEEDN